MADEKMTIAEMEAKIEQLKTEIVTRRSSAKSEIRTEIERLLSDAGLTIFDIYPDFTNKKAAVTKSKGKPKAAGEVKALYKDPASGAQWSGRGRTPRWVTGLCEKKGISVQKFKASSDFRI